jgi:endoglucanase
VDSYRSIALAHPYGRATGSQYYWGINGVLARGGLNVGVYEALVPRAENREVLVSMLDHLLGRNYYGRSYVTGVGEQPPYSPHHRPSASDDNAEPWPGLLIGGPETEATDWVDSAADYRTNEVAINWNGAMIYTVAALIPNE